MNKLKIYLRTTGDIEKQGKTYAKVFKGIVLKNSYVNEQDVSNEQDNNKESLVSFAYIKILNDINILIGRYKDKMPQRGFNLDTVITIETKELFDEIYNNLKNDEHFKLDYDKTNYVLGNGITLTKFYDVWGYGWILETKWNIPGRD